MASLPARAGIKTINSLQDIMRGLGEFAVTLRDHVDLKSRAKTLASEIADLEARAAAAQTRAMTEEQVAAERVLAAQAKVAATEDNAAAAIAITKQKLAGQIADAEQAAAQTIAELQDRKHRIEAELTEASANLANVRSQHR